MKLMQFTQVYDDDSKKATWINPYSICYVESTENVEEVVIGFAGVQIIVSDTVESVLTRLENVDANQI